VCTNFTVNSLIVCPSVPLISLQISDKGDNHELLTTLLIVGLLCTQQPEVRKSIVYQDGFMFEQDE